MRRTTWAKVASRVREPRSGQGPFAAVTLELIGGSAGKLCEEHVQVLKDHLLFLYDFLEESKALLSAWCSLDATEDAVEALSQHIGIPEGFVDLEIRAGLEARRNRVQALIEHYEVAIGLLEDSE